VESRKTTGTIKSREGTIDTGRVRENKGKKVFCQILVRLTVERNRGSFQGARSPSRRYQSPGSIRRDLAEELHELAIVLGPETNFGVIGGEGSRPKRRRERLLEKSREMFT